MTKFEISWLFTPKTLEPDIICGFKGELPMNRNSFAQNYARIFSKKQIPW